MFIWFYKSDCYDYCENELRQRRLELSPLTRKLFHENRNSFFSRSFGL